ncbi:MAG TPA: (2Fe-2S)-binding protein, partial [Gammaproteobacteria bacterium]
WHAFLATRQRVDLTQADQRVDYWACAKGEGYWRYEFAAAETPPDWRSRARELLALVDGEGDWAEFMDPATGQYRAAHIAAGRLEGCLFVGPGAQLPPRDWLLRLFALERLDDAQRRSLLSGRPAQAGEDQGAVVCACFGVGRNRLLSAIRGQDLTSVEAIGAALKAGSNCGSCIPELKTLLAEGRQACASCASSD